MTKPTAGFQRELEATLELLGKETGPEAISDGCPEPESILAYARGRAVDDSEIAAHLDHCSACAELASVARRQKRIYERQKQAFESSARGKPSFAQTLQEAFQPLAWVARPAGIVCVAAVLVAAVGLAVWDGQYSRRPTAERMSNTGGLVVSIEKSDPRNPESTTASIEEILNETQQGKEINPAQIRDARLVVDQKKAQVAGTPALAMQWDRIDDQLAVVELWNRYSALRKKAGHGMVQTASAHPSELSGSDGTGRISITWNLTGHDRSLLKDSLAQTDGLTQVIVTNPEGKTITLASSDKDSNRSRPQPPLR